MQYINLRPWSASGGFGWLVTSGLAESPILSHRGILCATAKVYVLPAFQMKKKTTASARFIIKIHHGLIFYNTIEGLLHV